MDNYSFVPAYYEWHLIDDNGNVLLNMKDPFEMLFDETDESGQLLEQPRPITTLDGVLDVCKDFIEVEKMCLESDYPASTSHGNNDSIFDLPDNAAEIMAKALFDYYIAA